VPGDNYPKGESRKYEPPPQISDELQGIAESVRQMLTRPTTEPPANVVGRIYRYKVGQLDVERYDDHINLDRKRKYRHIRFCVGGEVYVSRDYRGDKEEENKILQTRLSSWEERRDSYPEGGDYDIRGNLITMKTRAGGGYQEIQYAGAIMDEGKELRLFSWDRGQAHGHRFTVPHPREGFGVFYYGGRANQGGIPERIAREKRETAEIDAIGSAPVPWWYWFLPIVKKNELRYWLCEARFAPWWAIFVPREVRSRFWSRCSRCRSHNPDPRDCLRRKAHGMAVSTRLDSDWG
jgi:hypothetical protein